MQTEDLQQQPNNAPEPPTPGYVDAAQQGWWRVWNNRFLWFWGIFLPAGLSLGFNFSLDEKDLERIEQESQSQTMQQIMAFFSQHQGWILLGISMLALLFIAFWLVSLVAKPGIIHQLDCLQQKRKQSYRFSSVWHAGNPYFKLFLQLDLLVGGVMVGLFLVLFIPVMMLILTEKMVGAAILGVLAFLLYLPIMLLVVYLRSVSAIRIVLVNQSIRLALEESYHFISKNIREALKLLLLFFVLDIVRSIIILAVVVFLVVIAAAGAIVLGKEQMTQVIILTSFFSFVLIGCMLFIKSMFGLWQQDLWLWWTKRHGGILAEIKEQSEDHKLPVEKTEPVIGVEK